MIATKATKATTRMIETMMKQMVLSSSSSPVVVASLSRNTAANMLGLSGAAAPSIPCRSLSSAAQTATTTTEEKEIVTVLRLNHLRDNPGAVKKRRRVGRGIGSSKGKTCGKGHKGQKARNRSSIPNLFEGGQTRLYKLLPKRGFTNKRHKKNDMVPLNLGSLQDAIDMGRFPQVSSACADADTGNEKIPIITVLDLMNAGLIKKSQSCPGVKLLAKGKERFKTPIRLLVNRASEKAVEALESVHPGAAVTTVHYNRLAMKAHAFPDKFSHEKLSKKEKHRRKLRERFADEADAVDESAAAADDDSIGEPHLVLPKQARPPPKLQTYYSSYKNRGYLCPEVQVRDWVLDARPDLRESFENALFPPEEKEKQQEVIE